MDFWYDKSWQLLQSDYSQVQNQMLLCQDSKDSRHQKTWDDFLLNMVVAHVFKKYDISFETALAHIQKPLF